MRQALPIAALPVVAVLLGGWVGPNLTGNDTGGIIAWSPEHQAVAREWAADHCARYHKHAHITSMHRRYGDYIGFACQFNPRAPLP